MEGFLSLSTVEKEVKINYRLSHANI